MIRAPPTRKKPKLRASTLRRLTSIPQHKIRHDNRHFPAGAGTLGSGSTNPAAAIIERNQQRPSSAGGGDDEEAASPTESPNERRKRFLTMSNLKRVFKALDLSDDNYIDADELYEACRKLGGKLSREEINDVIWEVDDDRNGLLSWNDYLTIYRRSRDDELGFEPKRFYAIVEFLLMDRDCSGEISLDEAMTTIFERQGADNLGDATHGFFKAAGVGDGEEPPPGTTITFANYYAKVGCAKPIVPSIVDTRSVYSRRLFADTFGHEPPKLRPTTSAGQLPMILRNGGVPMRPQSHHGGRASSSLIKSASAFGLSRGSTPSIRPGTTGGSGRALSPISPSSMQRAGSGRMQGVNR